MVDSVSHHIMCQFGLTDVYIVGKTLLLSVSLILGLKGFTFESTE